MKWLSTHGPLALVGLAAGTVAGLFGVGGGIIMVPLLVMAFGYDQVVAQGTSLAVVVPLGIAGCLRYQLKGNVDWNIAIALAIGGIIGASFIGAPFAHLLKESVLRKMFGGLLVIAGLRMIGVFAYVGEAFNK